MILYGIFERIVDKQAPGGLITIKRAVFSSKEDAMWFLNNYPDAKASPARWFADQQGSVNW